MTSQPEIEQHRNRKCSTTSPRPRDAGDHAHRKSYVPAAPEKLSDVARRLRRRRLGYYFRSATVCGDPDVFWAVGVRWPDHHRRRRLRRRGRGPVDPCCPYNRNLDRSRRRRESCGSEWWKDGWDWSVAAADVELEEPWSWLATGRLVCDHVDSYL